MKNIQHKENYIASLAQKIEKEGDAWFIDFFNRLEKLFVYINDIYKASSFKNVYFNKKNNLTKLEKKLQYIPIDKEYKCVNPSKIKEVTKSQLDEYFQTINDLNEVIYKECHDKKFFNEGFIGDGFKLKAIQKGLSKEEAVNYIYNLFVYEIIKKFHKLKLKNKIEYTLNCYHKEKYEKDMNEYIDSIMYEESNFAKYEESLRELRLGMYGKLFTYIEYQNQIGRYDDVKAQKYKDMIRHTVHSAQEIMYRLSEVSSDKRSKNAKENLYKIKIKSTIDKIVKKMTLYERVSGVFFYSGVGEI